MEPVLGAEVFDLAQRMTHRFIAGHPGTAQHYDDILSDACLGAVEAAKRWDSTRGVTLWTFSWSRILGAINDGVRTRASVRHSLYVQGVRLEDLLPAQRRPLSLDEITETGFVLNDPMASLTTGVENHDQLVRLCRSLTAREYEVIVLVDLCGWYLREVGERMGVTEARISQIRTGALAHMLAADQALPE